MQAVENGAAGVRRKLRIGVQKQHTSPDAFAAPAFICAPRPWGGDDAVRKLKRARDRPVLAAAVNYDHFHAAGAHRGEVARARVMTSASLRAGMMIERDGMPRNSECKAPQPLAPSPLAGRVGEGGSCC